MAFEHAIDLQGLNLRPKTDNAMSCNLWAKKTDQ